jgi:hypothetical protein
MINLYTALFVDFNWWLFLTFICAWVAFFVPGFRNVFVQKNRFLYGDRYGMLFCFGFPISVMMYLVLHEGYFANKVLVWEREIVQGKVELKHSEPGWEVVNLGDIPLERYKYKHTNFPTHCWQGRFEDEIKSHPRATFRLEIVWVDGGNLYEGTTKYKEAFPCILKVDVLTNAS